MFRVDSGRLKVVLPFIGGESGQAVGNDGPEFVNCFGCGLSEARLELGGGHLDRVDEVWRGWQQEQARCSD
ncbi:hypothetical protein GGD84_002955 [Rhodothalassium salexigens DSM 2132]|nr:hypothetical protein [Rhodothalassium salexigens DSM 2132]